jgi:hypothetical protein
MSFPTVTGSNLERRRMNLPADFEGDLNLVVLAFWQRHQALVNTWMPLAGELEKRHPGLAFYELPVIQKRSRVSQWFIDSGMRAGIADRRVRERTITLYLDKPPFLRDLGITDDGTIYAMVVDRTGRILWRASGPLVDAAESDLTNFLENRPVA